jgi:DNA-binding CsgD family transcriptional regulator
VTPIGRRHYAFGTILNGVYLVNEEGQIVQHLNKKKGILNNTVLSLHYSPAGSLWLGMDYGVSALRLSSDMAYVLDHQGEFGTGQTALLQGEDFYLGTNQGLYYARWEDLANDGPGTISFALIPGSAGQVWALQNLNGTIWCGHDQGLFLASPQGLAPVHTGEGVLAIAALTDRYLVTGTYNGLSLFERRGQQWTFARKLTPVQGACSQVIADGDSLLWVNIPNFGIIKVRLDADVRIKRQRMYLSQAFEGESLWLQADSLGVHLSTDRQTYAYDAKQDSFLRMGPPAQVPPMVNRLPTTWPGLPLNDACQFFPVFNGFGLYHPAPPLPEYPPAPVLIRSLTAFNNDTTVSFGQAATIPSSLNNIRVQFLVPHQAQTLYRHRLVHFEDQWSEWSPQNSHDFLDLPEGDYELLVEAKRLAEVVRSQPLFLTISPPWYRRWYSYLGVALLAISWYYLLRLRNRRKLSHLQAQLEATARQAQEKQAVAHQHDTMVQAQQRSEAELADLKKRLRAKTIELAKKSKENEDRNRLLQTLKDKIAAIEGRSSESNHRWAEMSRLLDHNLTFEDHTFDMQIDELNQDFLRRLKASYPALTPYDLRLATYLKLGMSSREIAELLNVLPSSVNVSRSRLRKKLTLDIERDLYEFLTEI